MTIQQWLFSFKGRIGRRDFWIWIGLWFAGMLVLCYAYAYAVYLLFEQNTIFRPRRFALCACFGQQRQ